MQPIVNGLEEQYGQQIDFLSLNARDGGVGEAAFQDYALRGHPSVMLVLPDGQISAVMPGVVPREELEQAILQALASG